MAGEESKATATDEDVADDVLAKEYDRMVSGEETEPEVAESEETPVVEPEQQPHVEGEAEPDAEHKENSKLGRKFKGLESKFDQMLERLDKLAASQRESSSVPSSQNDDEELEKIRDLYTVDPIEANRKQREYETRTEAKQQNLYESGYIRKLQTFTKDEGEMFEDIYNEMLANFNVKHVGNPDIDAELNWNKAKASLLSKKLATPKEPKLPGKGGGKEPPITPSGSETRNTTVSKIPLPAMDSQTAAYVSYLRKQGVGDDEIAETLKE